MDNLIHMIKILLINTVPTGKNGITNVLFNYLRAMDTADMQMDLVAINQPDDYYVNEVEKKGGHVYVLPRLHGTISYWMALYNLIRENRYDAVHIHGNSHTTILELSAAKFAECKVRIVHAHSTKCSHIVVHRLLKPIFNSLYTCGIACGEAAGKFMYGNNPFDIINNGVDTEKFAFNQNYRDAIRNKHNLHGCKVIGHVGYFSEVKNHFWIIEIFRNLVKKDNTCRLLLIGDGKLKSVITEMAKDYGIIDRIIFTGNINNVDEYLNAMDLVLMPSLYEGLPLSLIEQQANGLICIVSDRITQEVDKSGNIHFVSLSVPSEEWANIVLDKLNSKIERGKKSIKAIENIEKCGYSIHKEAKKLYGYYNKNLI